MTNLPKSRIKDLEQRLGHKFKKPVLLQQALTHRSLQDASVDNYERMEFLGDRVLGMVIAELLLKKYPGEAEGQISRRFSALVSQVTLAEVGQKLDLAQDIQMVSEQEQDCNNPSILSDVLEAIIAAVYYDGGLSAAEKFIKKHWRTFISEKTRPPKDAKTALQEWAQSRGRDLPMYRIMDKQGPDHSPVFKIAVEVSGIPVVSAFGASKKQAEQEAAQMALNFIGVDVGEDLLGVNDAVDEENTEEE